MAVIYCVVPEALADELFDKLTTYYADEPNVTVIVERRKRARRSSGRRGSQENLRVVRDRRRPRVVGEFPQTPAAE